MIGVGADAGPLHLGQDGDERQLDLVQQPGRAAPLQVLIQRGGEVERRPRAQHERESRLLLPRSVQGELHVVTGGVAQLLAEVAQREVGKVESPLAGQREIRGEGGVRGESMQHEAVRCQRVHRPLGVVHRLGASLRRQPLPQGALVGGSERGRVEVGAGAVGGGDRDAGHPAHAAQPLAVKSKPHPFGRCAVPQAAGDLLGTEDGRVDLECRWLRGWAGGGGGLRRAGQAVGEGLVEAVAQHAELQGVEELVGSSRGPTAPGSARPGPRRRPAPAGRGAAW